MFLCFEGLAGGGKTTQANLLADYLRRTQEKEVFVSAVYEGEARKRVSDFMHASGIASDQRAVMFLFQALHAAQHRGVSDALDEGKIVIADRWRDSFFAHHLYQGTFNGDEDLMRQIDQLAFGSLEPDVCFLIDVPAEVAYDRYVQRERRVEDKGLELMGPEYFSSVANYYRKIAHDKHWHVVDGTKDQQSVFEHITSVIKKDV